MSSSSELIEQAAAVIKPHTGADGRLHADVGAAVLSAEGKTYVGVCVDTSSWGLCAERSALAGMISAGEYRFSKIVAVWRDLKTMKLHVLPPCGICREFMRRIDESNLESLVVLGRDTEVSLRDLIPYHEWPAPLEEK